VARGTCFQFTTLLVEDLVLRQAPFLQSKLHGRGEYSKTILHAASEIDRRCFSEVLGRTRDLSDAESEKCALREHLIVENKIVGVFKQGKLHQDLTAESSIAGVVFRNLDAQKQVFKGSQQAVENILVKRHPAAQCLPSNDSRPEHNIVDPI